MFVDMTKTGTAAKEDKPRMQVRRRLTIPYQVSSLILTLTECLHIIVEIILNPGGGSIFYCFTLVLPCSAR